MAGASALFVIEEVEGAVGETFFSSAVRFEWTAADQAPGPNGGARAIPRKPWKLPGKLRTVRTDYPGAISPSEQVLGPRFEPFTLSGRWDDRYNFAGYAVREKQRFEDLCRRGKPVRITFEDEVYEGLITDWDFERRKASDISYTFTFSNHGHPGKGNSLPVAPDPVASAPEVFDKVVILSQGLIAEHDTAPSSAITGPSRRGIDEVLGELSVKLNTLSDQLDTNSSRALRPLTTFKRIGTQLRMVSGDAFAVLEQLVAVRSDTELGIRNAITVLDFEVWRRSVAYQSRLLLGQANRGAREMDARAEADPIRVYRPFRGESLYSVSRRFYGTPHSWRLIADRNGLQALTLDGSELLMIPVRGEG